MGTPSRCWLGWALRLLLLFAPGASEVVQPYLFQPQPSVTSGHGNPQIWCVVRGGPAGAHVLSWYQQLVGGSPTFLLSQREGVPPAYGLGVNPRFLAEMDPDQNAARLTVGNASPADEGTYYCAMWLSGRYIFGEGTRVLYQAEVPSQGLRPPELNLFMPASGHPFHALCVALGHQPGPLRLSWALRGRPLEEEEEDFPGGAGDSRVSWLQLPREVAGMPVSCRGQHQGGTSEVVLAVPGDQGAPAVPGCRTPGPEGCSDTQDSSGEADPLAALEKTLTAATYCYLGLLGAAQVYSLILAAAWRHRGCRLHPMVPCAREG